MDKRSRIRKAFSTCRLLVLGTALLVVACGDAFCEDRDGWHAVAVRDEIRPLFSIENSTSDRGNLALVIRGDGRKGLNGKWTKIFPVDGGKYYRFQVTRRIEKIESPRRSTLVRITWLDDQDRNVRDDTNRGNRVITTAPGYQIRARSEFPRETVPPGESTVQFDEVYQTPSRATRARVELVLRWAPEGTVKWSDVMWNEVEQPATSRHVRLAAIHFRPRGAKSAADNCRQFLPFIRQAAEKKAELVCLPEYVTCTGNNIVPVHAAESIPGPSTDYFGKLARQFELHIIAGLVERSDHLIYNTAVLIGPDGDLIGKYRKVCITDNEIQSGFTPGTEYPVFDTSFGKVGMMICWDVHFPEIARRLSNNGAEIIAMPIAGGNPRLASARAIENQVYLLTSTLTDNDTRPNWMRSGLLDHDGRWVVAAEKWGDVVIADVNLAEPTRWDTLGHFRNRIWRERPNQ